MKLSEIADKLAKLPADPGTKERFVTIIVPESVRDQIVVALRYTEAVTK